MTFLPRFTALDSHFGTVDDVKIEEDDESVGRLWLSHSYW